MEKSRGIIIRLTKFSETSVIVHWCTMEHGLIKTVAKGARRSNSAFSGKLDLFFQAELNWVKSRKGELHTLREVAVSQYRENLRKRYLDTLLASYFGELLAHVAELDHPMLELFDLLERGLNYLEKEGGDKRGFLHYEREMARLLGVEHGQMSGAMAIERAFGGLPRGRKQCLDLMDSQM